MGKPKIYASRLATLVGQNPFEPREHALYRMACEMYSVPCRAPSHEQKVQSIVQRAQQPAAMNSFVEKMTADVLASPPENDNNNMNELIETRLNESPVALSARDKDILRQEVRMARGKIKEDDTICEAVETPQFKNAYMQVPLRKFILGGRPDALTEEYGGRIVVVEVKNRMRKSLNPPPAYDIIQLRCYMRMFERADGMLVEEFPDGTIRKTPVPWEEDEWQKLEDECNRQIDYLLNLSASELCKLIKLEL